MTIRALIIEPDGTHECRDVPPTYPEFNDAVLDGGLMEELHGSAPDGRALVFVFDEEGKYKNLAVNPAATVLYTLCGATSLLPGDRLVGRVAVCGRAGESLADVPDSLPWT